MSFVLPAFAILVGIIVFVSAFFGRPWSRGRMGIGGGIVAFVVLVVTAQEIAWANVELNPVVSDVQSLAGRWSHSGTSFEVRRDGSWHCSASEVRDRPCAGPVRTGRWKFDGALELLDSVGARVDRLPLIAEGPVYPLLIVPDEDPDSWDPKKGFERSLGSPASYLTCRCSRRAIYRERRSAAHY
jgi:hypothetical protein